MGSYDVACSISGITIKCGDPTAFIPLTVNKLSSYGIGDKNHTLIGSECFYCPLTLPIFGEYEDYGRIKPIEDKNTEFLESLGWTLKNLINPQESTSPNVGSGMFVHRKIYEVVRDKCSSVDDDGGKWMNRTKMTEMYEDFVYDIKKARKEIEDIEKIDTSFFEDGHNWMKTFMISSDHKLFNFRKWPKFQEIYSIDVVEKGDLKDELIDFMLFATGMYSTNRIFFPAMNGWQFGNPWATKLLNEEAVKITKQHIKKCMEG